MTNTVPQVTLKSILNRISWPAIDEQSMKAIQSTYDLRCVKE